MIAVVDRATFEKHLFFLVGKCGADGLHALLQPVGDHALGQQGMVGLVRLDGNPAREAVFEDSGQCAGADVRPDIHEGLRVERIAVKPAEDAQHPCERRVFVTPGQETLAANGAVRRAHMVADRADVRDQRRGKLPRDQKEELAHGG